MGKAGDGADKGKGSINVQKMVREVEEISTEKREKAEKPKKGGGSYREVYRKGEGEHYEVHHMPADSISGLSRGEGPSIKMEKLDHQDTASWGNSKDAVAYREEQERLIKQGKFREAQQMDIDDIHEKFGDKYDDQIEEMLRYTDQLEAEGKI